MTMSLGGEHYILSEKSTNQFQVSVNEITPVIFLLNETSLVGNLWGKRKLTLNTFKFCIMPRAVFLISLAS